MYCYWKCVSVLYEYLDSDSEVGVLSRLDSGTDTDDVGSHVTRDSVCSTPTGSRRRSGSEGGDDGM